MARRTRSGKLFKPQWCGDVMQESPWAQPSDLLYKVLPKYLDSQCILKGRAVCSAWRAAFGSCVQLLQLDQPKSAAASRALGRRASAAFSSTTTLHIQRHHGKVAVIDLTGDTAVETDVVDVGAAAAAAAALLRPFGKLQSLQHLLLSGHWECKLLPSLLPLVPQLRVLDLTASFHPSSDLLVVANHLEQLRELVLDCGFRKKTLTGRAMGSRTDKFTAGTNDYSLTRYEPQHLAALARLPHLQLLEYPVPYGWSEQKKVQSLAAIAGLTALKTLHIFQSWQVYLYDVASHVTGVDCLSALSSLTHLKSDAGWTTYSRPADATAARHWQVAFAGMQHLRLLELDPVRISDPMLQAIGTLPQLQHLVLNMRDVGRDSQSSAAGAQAISHIPHVELLFNKGFSCESHRALVQLPNIKRLYIKFGDTDLKSDQAGVSAWSQEKCICAICYFRQH